MEELKTCPFCGSDCYVTCVPDFDWVVGCNLCPAGMHYLQSKKDAIEAWNIRIEDPDCTNSRG